MELCSSRSPFLIHPITYVYIIRSSCFHWITHSYVCVCVSVCICVCVCMYVCMCVRACVCVRVQCMYVCVHVQVHVQVSIWKCMSAKTNACMWMCLCMCKCMCVTMHVCIYMCVCVFQKCWLWNVFSIGKRLMFFSPKSPTLSKSKNILGLHHHHCCRCTEGFLLKLPFKII